MKIIITVVATLLVLAAGAAAFVVSGLYDIGADDHHTQPVLAMIELLRERSIDSRARDLEVHFVEDSQRIAAGARRYSALCSGCHLAPGVTKSDLRPGLYPHPPNLAQGAALDPKRVFWTIKHGIKMSAMPAWGKSLDDTEIWNVVAFVQKMPAMTPETYQDLLRQPAG